MHHELQKDPGAEPHSSVLPLPLANPTLSFGLGGSTVKAYCSRLPWKAALIPCVAGTVGVKQERMVSVSYKKRLQGKIGGSSRTVGLKFNGGSYMFAHLSAPQEENQGVEFSFRSQFDARSF